MEKCHRQCMVPACADAGNEWFCMFSCVFRIARTPYLEGRMKIE